MGPAGWRDVDTEEAQRLVSEGAVRVLDVRTPEEYRDLGHIPGALLLPVDLIASAPAVLPLDGAPVLVHCEHGIRSVAAARVLTQAGYPEVLNMTGGMSVWRGPREFGPEAPAMAGPSSWLLENVDLLPPRGARVLDVACGRGRHALPLAAAGFDVLAVDRDEDALRMLADVSGRLRLSLETRAMDLETDAVDLGDGAFDLIVVVHYLHRPLFPALRRALATGGLLLYETFTQEQARTGHPKNPAFLLETGELPLLVAPLEVVRQREGVFENRHVAAVAAVRRSG